MNDLLKRVVDLKKTKVKQVVDTRLSEFSSFKDKPKEEWFSELCFCLLTANSKAMTALSIQAELGPKGFCRNTQENIRQCIIRNKHRFHNNKSKYIVEARKHLDVRDKIQRIVKEQGQVAAREWLVKNVKGLGFKEASHFLRNTGHFELAILDRHIINLFIENGMLKEFPKPLSGKKYLEIEQVFNDIAKKLKMNSAELDLYMWYLKTGKILK